MAQIWQFELPTRVQFGRGGLRRLGETARPLGSAALLVGYRDRTGLESAYAKAETALAEAGLSVTPFFEVDPDPDDELAVRGAARITEAGVDLVVALGGGSVIDAAKGMAAVAKMGGRPWDYAGANPDSRPVTRSVPTIAVPTTAGTGSEVSAVAVFTHHGVGPDPGQPLKASISGPAIRPAVALVDPDLAVGSPPGLTAACGADAFGHAVETMMSRRANPLSGLLATEAVVLIFRHLEAAVAEPGDPVPREPLALAATLAGAAFGQSGVVVTHAVAQALGGILHVPHGAGVALATPLTLRYNLPPCQPLYAQLADACGLKAASAEARAEAFIQAVSNLFRSVGLPDHWAVPGGVSDQLVGQLVQNARQSTPVPITLNPRKVDDRALEAMFRQILR